MPGRISASSDVSATMVPQFVFRQHAHHRGIVRAETLVRQAQRETFALRKPGPVRCARRGCRSTPPEAVTQRTWFRFAARMVFVTSTSTIAA